MDQAYKKLAVRVNTGSGCLFQPDSDEFTYVLTAKHNIEDGGKLQSEEDIEVYSDLYQEGETLKVIKVYAHNSQDAAILLISRIKDWEINIGTLESALNQQVVLYGYPERRGGNTWLGKGEIIQPGTRPNSFEIKPDERNVGGAMPEDSAAVGISGCGVFIENENTPIALVGIENSMAEERNVSGRLSCCSIKVYEEIILGTNNLPGLVSYNLTGFRTSIKELWNRGMLTNVSGVFIQGSQSLISKGITPLMVSKGSTQVYVLSIKKEWENDPELWKGVLELLTYKQLIQIRDFETPQEVLAQLTINKRIIFTKKEPWTGHIKTILTNKASSGLKPGASIFFNSENSFGISECSGKNILPYISEVSKTDFHFDRAMNLNKDLKFLHIDHIRNEIGRNTKLRDRDFVESAEIEEIKKEIMLSINTSFGNG